MEGKELTLVEHLDELRRRIIISFAVIFTMSLLAFPFASKILMILKEPSSGLIEKLAFFDPQEAFLVNIKIAFFTALLLSLPVILYQLWAFISPAMDEKIKKRWVNFLVFSLGAFISGSLFGFFILLPTALRFLLSFAQESLEPVISVSSYTSFVVLLILGCGLVFEMPVLSYLLTKTGVVTDRFLRSKWKYAVIIIFIAAAVITPTPDAFSMTILAIPMLLLYEVSIWVSKLAKRRR